MKNLILYTFVIICVISCTNNETNINIEEKKNHTNNSDLIWELLYEEKNELLAMKYNIGSDTAKMILVDYVSHSKYIESATIASILSIEKKDTLSVDVLVNLIAKKYELNKSIISSYLLDFQLNCSDY